MCPDRWRRRRRPPRDQVAHSAPRGMTARADAGRAAVHARREARRRALRSRRVGRVGSEKRRRELVVEERCDSEGRQPLTHDRAECAEDFVREEPIERFGYLIEVVLDLGRGDAREPDHRRPTVREQDQPRCGARTPADENVCSLAVVHRERRLIHLERISVHELLRGDPRGAEATRDEERDGRGRHERLDEVLCARLCGDLVVVVDHEPRVGRPLPEVLSENLGQRLGVVRGRR